MNKYSTPSTNSDSLIVILVGFMYATFLIGTLIILYKIKKSKVFLYFFYGFNLFGPLNTNISSFNDGIHNRSIVNLSTPKANPPCGGQPYLKNSK